MSDTYKVASTDIDSVTDDFRKKVRQRKAWSSILRFLYENQDSPCIDGGNLYFGEGDADWAACDVAVSQLVSEGLVETCDIGCFYSLTATGVLYMEQVQYGE